MAVLRWPIAAGGRLDGDVAGEIFSVRRLPVDHIALGDGELLIPDLAQAARALMPSCRRWYLRKRTVVMAACTA
jgi:hypothetical protein